MTASRPVGPNTHPSLGAKIAPWFLALSSALIGIFLVEIFCWLFVPSIGSNIPGRDRRVVFFEGESPIFENHDGIFNYRPHAVIRNVTDFLTTNSYSTEYDYRLRTNNLGLVQDGDVAPGRESLILLGDSFTEGQGSEPWFRQLVPFIERQGYQPINGGVLGTGFAQWLKLDRYLSARNIQIGKVLVLFISDDYHRPVWSIPASMFDCLSASPLCRVENSYFYRLPPEAELSKWISDVRKARGPLKPRLSPHPAALMPASYSVYMYIRQLLLFADAERDSRAAISELVKIYGSENVVFLHLPQRNELGSGPDSLGLRARKAIEDAGGKLFDGFKLCNLTTADYFTNDDHPNADGYRKIASCAKGVIKDFAEGKATAG